MKLLFIDAIVGIGFPTVSAAILAEKAELAKFVGDHSGPAWCWARPELLKQSEKTLQTLYESLRYARDKELVIPEEVAA